MPMPYDLAALGVVIRRERKSRSLSQENLAALAHLSRAYVGEVERGEVSLSVSTLAAIAEGMNLTLSQLAEKYEDEHGPSRRST